jgi:hypothetical protein
MQFLVVLLCHFDNDAMEARWNGSIRKIVLTLQERARQYLISPLPFLFIFHTIRSRERPGPAVVIAC